MFYPFTANDILNLPVLLHSKRQTVKLCLCLGGFREQASAQQRHISYHTSWSLDLNLVAVTVDSGRVVFHS